MRPLKRAKLDLEISLLKSEELKAKVQDLDGKISEKENLSIEEQINLKRERAIYRREISKRARDPNYCNSTQASACSSNVSQTSETMSKLAGENTKLKTELESEKAQKEEFQNAYNEKIFQYEILRSGFDNLSVTP